MSYSLEGDECAAGIHCILGKPIDRVQHWCRSCKKPVHAICGEQNPEDYSIEHATVCFTCTKVRGASMDLTSPSPSFSPGDEDTTLKTPGDEDTTLKTPPSASKSNDFHVLKQFGFDDVVLVKTNKMHPIQKIGPYLVGKIKVASLKGFCVNNKIRGYRAKNKSQLIQLIAQHVVANLNGQTIEKKKKTKKDDLPAAVTKPNTYFRAINAFFYEPNRQHIMEIYKSKNIQETDAGGMRHEAQFAAIEKSYNFIDCGDEDEDLNDDLTHWMENLHYTDDLFSDIDLNDFDELTKEDLSQLWYYIVRLWRKHDNSPSGDHRSMADKCGSCLYIYYFDLFVGEYELVMDCLSVELPNEGFVELGVAPTPSKRKGQKHNEKVSPKKNKIQRQILKEMKSHNENQSANFAENLKCSARRADAMMRFANVAQEKLAMKKKRAHEDKRRRLMQDLKEYGANIRNLKRAMDKENGDDDEYIVEELKQYQTEFKRIQSQLSGFGQKEVPAEITGEAGEEDSSF